MVAHPLPMGGLGGLWNGPPSLKKKSKFYFYLRCFKEYFFFIFFFFLLIEFTLTQSYLISNVSNVTVRQNKVYMTIIDITSLYVQTVDYYFIFIYYFICQQLWKSSELQKTLNFLILCNTSSLNVLFIFKSTYTNPISSCDL